MRKAIIGVAVVGAVVGLAVVSRRVGHKMREHCGQMAAQCKQMMAGQFGEPGEAAATRKRCGEMAAQVRETREQAPQVVGQGEAVGVA